MKERGGLFILNLDNQPISKAEVVGVIVNILVRPKRITYHIDDGTNVLRCIKFISETYRNNGKYI